MLVLEELDLGGLLSLSQINQEFLRLTTDVFKRRFSTKSITIDGDFPKPVNETFDFVDIQNLEILSNALKRLTFWKEAEDKPFTHSIHPSEIKINDYEMLLKTFKYFGHTITKLRVNYCIGKHLQAKLIGKLISKYLSESLTEVEFLNSKAKTIEYITKPLINVISVSFGGSIHKTVNEDFPINQLFPAVRRLYISKLKSISIYFDCLMPNLEHVYLDGENYRYEYHKFEPFIKMITKNPQIQSIGLFRTSLDFLDILNIWLPKLEKLSINTFGAGNVKLIFKNVKELKLENPMISIANLQFPKLEMLNINIQSGNIDKWIDFIKKNKQLKQLYLQHSNLTDKQFEQMIIDLENLKEMSIMTVGTESISTEMLVKIIKNHEKLEKVHLNSYKPLNEEIINESIDEISTEISMETIQGTLQKQLATWNVDLTARGIFIHRRH